ncbi:MAG: cobalt-precorrin-4 C(11)-methyltransferase, partial [Ruminococcus sp.]|nr:cobalt-precorrin-4 C(11)-methyltransferase [Ruminococcus sp.]
EKVMHCTVGTLAETAEREKVNKTALIVVGNVLNTEYERSKLYDPAFTTEFRKGKEV